MILILYEILYVLILTVINQVLCNHSYEQEEKIPHKIIYKLDSAKDLFENFVKKYGKKYANKNEFFKRLQIFEESLKRINNLNLEYDSTNFGITQFSDMTYEEVSKCYMGVSNDSNYDIVQYAPTGYAPQELDYRTQGLVTEIKSQQTCGACFAFSAIANIESQYAKKYGQLVSLSEQQGLDCEPTGNCDRGGQVHNVMQALAGQGGSMKNEDYPYENAKGICRTDRKKIVVRVTGGNQIGVNEDGLADALANYGPLSVYINTCPEFDFYVSGIFKTTNCAGTLHAVLLVGYGTAGGEPYWIIKNSWGTNWGEQGHARLRRGMGVCNIGSYAATATVA